VKNSEKKRVSSGTKRRSFLKKAVYHAPVLYAMGSLVKPVATHADATGGPDGPPGGGDPFSSNSGTDQREDTPKPRKTLRF